MNGKDTESSYKTLVQGRTGVQHKSATPETKEFSALLHIKSVDLKNRRIKALVSTGNIDRDDEIILPEAFRESLPIYMKNPVVLAGHQHKLETGQSSVVANIVKADIVREGLLVVLEFHCLTQLSTEYWDLYSQKKQRAFSVGFISHEGGIEEVAGRKIYVHRKVELLEVSCVPVPSNRESLTRSKQRKIAWINEKKEQDGMDELERELLELDPSYNKKAADERGMELAELWLGTDIEGELVEEKTDYAGIVTGKACGEFAAIMRKK